MKNIKLISAISSIFEKSTNNTLVIDNKKENTKQYSKEVLEIHHEFETAADKLLEEANIVLEQAKKADITKVSRLEALGFKQANQVTELKPLLKQAELSKEQIELINYYKQNYPFNKFITEEQVKTICYKYNLVCGDVTRYKGFVPEKNLRQIEKFKVKNADNIITGTLWGNGLERVKHSITVQEYDNLRKKELIHDDVWCFAVDIGVKHYKYFDKLSKLELQICAPIKDMDTSGLELKNGYKLEKKFIPDPVVLQPVKGGYLIITAWGDEASDQLVVNEINN